MYRAYWYEVNRERRKEREIHSREISWQGVSGTPDEDTLSIHAAYQPPSVESATQSAALREALATEPPELVEALWALANKEKTLQEIADQWGISPQGVRQKAERAYKRLRKKLEANENF